MRAFLNSIWTFLVWAHFSATATVLPAAIGVDPSQQWDGNDGSWSSFTIRVGNPAQNQRVFISTAATSTWVIASLQGCEGFGLPDCANIRGGTFDSNTSSTWQDNGGFDLMVESNLGLDDGGEYGFDTVGLGFQGSGGPTLNHTVVAEISTGDYLIGMLGLNPRPTNFSTFNDPQPSYLSLLYEQNIIPSLSYSYSAGAKYRNNEVLGDLILGGYDDSLYQENDITFGFDFDQSRDLTVGIQSITSQVGTNTASLLPNGILSLIDSTVSQIWLPLEACQLFEKVFGLVYDNNTELYLLNSTQHASLLAQNPIITFTLGLSTSGGQTVDITFPYAAFDQNISYPAVTNTTAYFPLKRATNSTQYTLGRTFLQEAYLTVDYLRSNFSVSQRTWAINPQHHIVSITPPFNATNGTGSGSSGNSTSGGTNNATSKSGISTGAIAGIAIAAVILIVLVAGGLFYYFRIYKPRKQQEKESADMAVGIAVAAAEEQQNKQHDNNNNTLGTPSTGITELASPYKDDPQRPELHGSHGGSEVDGGYYGYEVDAQDTTRYELEAPHGMHEMSTLRPMRRDERWGETSSPISQFSTVSSRLSPSSSFASPTSAQRQTPSPRQSPPSRYTSPASR